MQNFVVSLRRNLPKLILSFILAFTVWIFSVTESDPTEEKLYPQPITIEFIGQDPALIAVNDPAEQISLTLSAPQSIWQRLLNENLHIRAVVDLSGLTAGQHILPVQVQVGIRPVQIVSFSPSTIPVELEPLASREINIQLVEQGETAVGYQADTAQMSEKTVVISGPETLVEKVQEVRAILNYNRATENISRLINLQAYDAGGGVIEGVTLTPDRVNVSAAITQRGGYRNVVVKTVLEGQISTGYRVTNISVYPPAVTVFSSDPQLVSNLPGYVETIPLNISGANDDLDMRLPLNLPSGVVIIGEQTVGVQVGIAALEGSLTFNSMKVELIGLEEGLKAQISPSEVDIYLSGPIPVLDSLNKQNVRVILDLTGLAPGTYKRVPDVQVGDPDVVVESIIPSSVEVTITGTTRKGIITPTSTPTPAPTKTISPGS